MTPHQVESKVLPLQSDLSALAIDRTARSKRKVRASRPLWLTIVLMACAGVFIAPWLWRLSVPLAVETAAVSVAYPSQALTILNATGYVVAQRKASVASKATGRLEWLGVLEGSEVLAGEVVARLESRDLQAMRDLAAANVQVAEANLGQGRAELLEAELAIKRSEALTAKQLTSEQEHDSAVARLAKAEAALEGYTAAVTVAKANLRISEVDLDQTLIRAPFDGVVLTRNANVGDTITPFSQAVDTKGAVVTIADMDTLEVEVDVAETFFLSIRVGQPVEIQLDAIPGLRFQGVVSLMVPTVDRAKASTVVKIRFVDPDPRILPEMSAKAAFLQRKVNDAERKPVLVVPVSAIAGSDGDEAVYVIEDGMARMREVDVGAKIGEQIEVLGLEVGIRVIKRPPEELSDGRMVIEDVE
jgi:RND family efflux transporter MFP subunit